MNGAIIAIWPIALLIVLAIVGVPLWMTLRHRHAPPDYREARADYRARQAAPGAPTRTDYVPTEPVAAVDGLTIVRKTGTADGDGVAVPAQRHW
ncbi:MAG: hypothetical protein ACRDND_10460 [Streptosporangiaceae bacterium]